jgi:cystine transport system substrate-binding protein
MLRSSAGGVLAVLLILGGAYHAEGVEKPLRVAMGGEYLPLHGTEGGKATGFEADVASVLGEALGREVQFLSPDQMKAGALAALASGAADVALNAVTPTPERAKKADFTAPIAMLNYLVATGEGSGAEDFASACPRTVAVAEGPAASALRAADPAQKVIVAKSTDAAIAMLAEHKVDCAVGEDIAMLLAVNETDLTVIDEPVGMSPIAMAVPKGQGRAYDEALLKIAEQLKALRRKWQLREPQAGVVYPRIMISDQKDRAKGKAPFQYVVVEKTNAYSAANATSSVVLGLEPGDLLDFRQSAGKAGAWIEMSVAGKKSWVPAGHVVDLAGPFFLVSRHAPQADPNQPCVDTPCGCYVYKPTPENTVTLSPDGKRLMIGKFGEAAVRNPNVASRRRQARSVLRSLLDGTMEEIISRRHTEKESIASCWQGCRAEEVEGDGCCDCEEEELYTGFTEAFAAIERLADSFMDDPDHEAARRARIEFCSFLRQHPYPDVLYADSMRASQVFQGCGISDQ